MIRSSTISFSLLITLFCAYNSVKAQDSTPISEGHGFSEPPVRIHNCVSDEHRLAIIEQNKYTIRKLGLDTLRNIGLRAASLGWPLEQANGFNDPSYYLITNFVDQNKKTNALQDYNCGKRTYDGHKGTDISLWPFAWHKKNIGQVNVVAAQSGVIIGKDDGKFDDNCEWNNQSWNAVYLQHNDGTEGWYGHLKKNSLTTKKIGERVTKGEYLGKVGSSGISTGPHLHFELYSNDAIPRLLDPFGGSCNPLNTGLWEDQKPYLDPAILMLGTHDCVPFQPDGCPAQNFDLCEKEIFKPNDLIKFSVNYRQQSASIATSFKVFDSQNKQVYAWSQTPRDFDYGSWWYWEYRIASGAKGGIWRYTATFNGEIFEKEFIVQTSSDVTEITINEAITLTQNPAINELQVIGSENIKSFQIYTISGAKIAHGIWLKNQRIDITTLEPGIYFLKLTMIDGSYRTLKFVKVK